LAADLAEARSYGLASGRAHASKAAGGDGQALLAEGFPGGSDGVQRVALGAAAGCWPLGSADLQDAFPALL
jgi:hypothetical protein